ncbi:Ubiquinone/menaquinone biosynthesis C-methylase UbiE [Limimonas halophila]|uniref:Ubiquinone/menaquinone biosynthesis C-methylase UbiE n=1 Tax=Limimonas halophila TaxID=1082479 RepID=A0A1G7LDX1_9PROT|nr:class I SAM-dependent methyltransferase [Limimonas halophila]SDF47688.1 Ubiquinone/menaquinone biosynthesis C-methylase UbiE [Limimonas halophila]
MDDVARSVASHYSRHDDLPGRILAALPHTGGDPDHPTYEAVHHLDQFHLGGPPASRVLADLGELHGEAVLDVGCGIGGPARLLSQERGCTVTGVDLTQRYVTSARTISGWLGLGDATQFVCASALQLPVRDGAFSVAWSQHAAMNIPDKDRLYAEIARVLRPGGRFLMHDIVAGPLRDPYYPVPWAHTPTESFLLPANEVHARLRAAGLEEVVWQDASAEAIGRIRAARERAAAGEPEKPGPDLIMGPEFATMRENLSRSLEEARVSVVRSVWKKPGR